LFINSFDANSKLSNYNDGVEVINEFLSNNPQPDKDESDIVYKPIESSLNLSKIADKPLDPLVNATDTVEYDLRTRSEKISSRKNSLSTTFASIIEPFEGIVDENYMIERVRGEEKGAPRTSYVFYPDDRQKITNTTSFPWRSICKLYIETQDSSQYIASGFILDDFHILTCGHCVYVHDAGGWVAEIMVVPGMDGNYRPYGSAYATNLRSYTGWIESEMVEHDWAVVTLDRSIGQLTGWMGRQTAPSSSSIYTGNLNTAGYPGDLDLGENMYFVTNIGDRATEYNHWFWMDTAGGQSGSPIWREDESNQYILSIVAYESRGGFDANFGTRLNTDKFDQLNAWLAEDNSTVIEDKPDLLDRTYYLGVSNAELVKGETEFEIYCDVGNEGTAAASSFNVSFYVSDNSLITSDDYFLGNRTINNLDPYNYQTLNWSGLIPPEIPDGSYYIGWIIDSSDAIEEYNENNNQGVINSLLVEIKGSLSPDYGGMLILVIILLAFISLVLLTVIVVVVKRPGRRIEEGVFNVDEAQPYISHTSDVIKPYELKGLNFCTMCGYKRFSNSKFCVNCGYRFP
ncbi:MAG: CARDB domain-containing protein, partial [Candidatus Hermodarchaeota archaeon]